jgi:hypothetical protein
LTVGVLAAAASYASVFQHGSKPMGHPSPHALSNGVEVKAVIAITIIVTTCIIV